jgi:phospholipid N-methyltransferase
MPDLHLFKAFLRHPTGIGAILPSSAALARMMVAELELPQATAVAEIGPGTGPFTRELLRLLPPDCHFFTVERDAKIHAEFTSRFPEVRAHCRCAGELADILREEGIDGVDALVSGLPWAAFPATLQTEIMTAIVAALRPGGRFVTFAYLQGLPLPAGRRFRRCLEQHFREVRTSPVVWRNVPPALVYRCRKDA